MEPKLLWKSKTFWFNILAVLVIVAQAFGYSSFQPGPEVEQFGVVLVAIVNICLRIYTSQAVVTSKANE